jgi:hypothetical protein
MSYSSTTPEIIKWKCLEILFKLISTFSKFYSFSPGFNLLNEEFEKSNGFSLLYNIIETSYGDVNNDCFSLNMNLDSSSSYDNKMKMKLQLIIMLLIVHYKNTSLFFYCF